MLEAGVVGAGIALHKQRFRGVRIHCACGVPVNGEPQGDSAIVIAGAGGALMDLAAGF